ncbi:hypothetical protein [Roseiarcus sp.]|uniref:hypothetical protein n=1 Tax=Roseiarcus sp. TaxID=1969460 RepID=UPI003F9870FA
MSEAGQKSGFRALAAGAAAMAWMPFAFAQSTKVLPDLTTSGEGFDPVTVAGLPAEARAAFASAAARLRSGELAGFIFVASPDGATWTLNVAPRDMKDYNPSDSGRQALEICEYRAGRPCKVLSVDGYEARTVSGAPPEPQAMLTNRPSDFDATALPFAPASKRSGAAAYLAAKGPRAFAVTTSGLWLWRGGQTVREAIDKTMVDCAEAFKPAACILYAVGSRVVFGAE